MRWIQFSATLLIAAVSVLAWARFSIESGWRRRAAELYLWIGPALPFLWAALQAILSPPSGSASNLAPTAIRTVAPAAALHLVLLAVVWRTLYKEAESSFRADRLAAGLLIVGSMIVWFAAIAWPGMELAQIAQHKAEHVFASAGFLLGALVTLAGFVLLNSLLEQAGDRYVSRLGLVSLGLGTVCWAMHLAFRLTIALSLAQVGGPVPQWYTPLRMWAGAMYALYMPLAYIAIAAFGRAMLNVHWIGKGWGQSFIAFGLIATVGFAARSGIFDPPLVVNVMPYVAGILLLRRLHHHSPGKMAGTNYSQ